ncbi:MAG: Rrf2 family transcriptional regulator [Anaerolineae bacterium]|nr:Rrf2 family transcriptional regulator [Anaerolineae bacterium]
MRVSAKELYGLRAMTELARHFDQGPISLAEVSRTQGISLDYLEQIAASLRRAGLLESRRGAQGGYLLTRSPQAITAGDVIRALEGSILPVQCTTGLLERRCTPCYSATECTARNVWQTLNRRIVETLDGITLADLQ